MRPLMRFFFVATAILVLLMAITIMMLFLCQPLTVQPAEEIPKVQWEYLGEDDLESLKI